MDMASTIYLNTRSAEPSFAAMTALMAAGLSLIFGLMNVVSLAHGSFFMLGAYLGATFLAKGLNFWLAALASGAAMALIGGTIERLSLRRLAGQELPQVLLTLGLSFVTADLCLMIWGGDPLLPLPPQPFQGALPVFGINFPTYRLVILAIAVVIAAALWFMIDRTRLGAMIRAGVDDAPIARPVRANPANRAAVYPALRILTSTSDMAR